jgi:hypothetical protein
MFLAAELVRHSMINRVGVFLAAELVRHSMINRSATFDHELYLPVQHSTPSKTLSLNVLKIRAAAPCRNSYIAAVGKKENFRVRFHDRVIISVEKVSCTLQPTETL